ncbi:hypothetical protein FGF1_19420 [Flavobacteriaceae bacterium GF1]
MKILHCCLANFYIDNYGYQENILPKLHKLQGHEVEIVASTETYINNKSLGYVQPKKYVNENDTLVSRIPYINWLPHILVKKLRIYKGLNKVLHDFKPDIIFLHDCQFLSIHQIVNYAKKNNGTKIYVDGHTDFINSAKNWLSKNILHKIIYKYCAKKIEPYTLKFYGTLPSRVKFFVEVYGIDDRKVELLELGADDSSFDFSEEDDIRKKVRRSLGFKKKDFVLVSGGKLDRRKNIHVLMKSMNILGTDRIKLVIFGSPNTEMEKEMKELTENKNIIPLGWLSSNKIYDVLFASDLGFFPGTHSVLWEQCVGVGLPCVFKKWDDIDHVDVGGNCAFLEDITAESIANKILEIYENEELRTEMKKSASEKGVKRFSYSEIAKRAIQQ